MISLPRLPLSKVVLGASILTYPLRLANHFAEQPTYDTNARAREVLLAGIEKEQA